MRRNKLMNWIAGGMFTAFIVGSATMFDASGKSAIPGNFSGNVAVTSEYLFRGLSQSDESPALQGALDYDIEVADQIFVYAGTWGSNVDFNEAAAVDGASIELDFYSGLKCEVGRTGLSWDTGFIYYAYSDAAASLNYDFWEIQGAVSYDFGIAKFTASLNYSPDYFGASGDAFYTKVVINAAIPAVKGLSLFGHVADESIDDSAAFGTADYFEWNIGATYNVDRLFDVSINYSDTDVTPDVDGKDESVFDTFSNKF